MSLFLSLLNIQNASFDANAIHAKLLDSSFILHVGEFRAELFSCQASRDTQICETVQLSELQNDQLNFPLKSEFVNLLAEKRKKYPHIFKAILTHTLTDAERLWLAKVPAASLVLPRSVQNRVRSYSKTGASDVYGIGTNAVFTFVTQDLLEQNFIKLEFDIEGLDWFGPGDLPMSFAIPEKADEYLSLTSRQQFAGSLASQMEIGFPVLLAAIAIVLDHSPVFGVLSLYAAARAGRSYLGFLQGIQNSLPGFMTELGIYLCNTLVFVMILIFAFEISGLSSRYKSKVFALTVVAGGVLFVTSFLLEDFFVTADLWVDFAGTALAIPIILLGAASVAFKKDHEKNRYLLISSPTVELGILVFFGRAVLVIAGLSIHGWVNISELLSLSQSSLKNPLDWKHIILFPVFFVAAILEVGSVARRMTGFAQKATASAVLEKEVNLAKTVQKRMLPGFRKVANEWEWRAFYHTASSLGADWFDVREVEFANGKKILAACLIDLTGHGIGPALVTSAICAQWSLWCMELRKYDLPEEDAAREKVLAWGAQKIHVGLRALGRNDACTGALILLDPTSSKLTYCTAGHPGIIVHNKDLRNITYLQSHASGLGDQTIDVLTHKPWPAKTEFLPSGSLIFLYSDGLIPPGKSLAVWLRHLEKTLKISEKPLLKLLVEQMRKNRTLARTDVSIPGDDMTLVAVYLHSLSNHPKETHNDTPHPETVSL